MQESWGVGGIGRGVERDEDFRDHLACGRRGDFDEAVGACGIENWVGLVSRASFWSYLELITFAI